MMPRKNEFDRYLNQDDHDFRYGYGRGFAVGRMAAVVGIAIGRMAAVVVGMVVVVVYMALGMVALGI